MIDTKHTLVRDGLRYARTSDRGQQILKAERERRFRLWKSLITITCVMCACGITLFTTQSFI